MLKHLDLPGFGQAVAGLDWLTIDGLESESTEIRQLARSSNAAWQIVWPSPQIGQDKQVAFLSKGDSKKKPYCAALLLKAAIQESTFLCLLTLDDPDMYWVFALVDGMPAKRLDLVADKHTALNAVRDFITSDASSKNLPVYTDQPDMLMDIPYQMDLRPMTVEILRHSIQKQDFTQSAFKTYFPISRAVIVAVTLMVVASAGYVAYQAQAQSQRKQQLARAQLQAQAANLAKLQHDIETAINVAKPMRALKETMRAVHQIPMAISGWRLSQSICQVDNCMLAFKAQPLATWQAYVQSKPPTWPEPVLPNDIERIEQPIVITQESFKLRTPEQLPERNAISFELGNLAQISKTIGVNMSIGSTWEPVAVPAGPMAVELPIPASTKFIAKGPAVLLSGFVKRLPEAVAFKEIELVNDDKETTFTLTGEVYALH